MAKAVLCPVCQGSGKFYTPQLVSIKRVSFYNSIPLGIITVGLYKREDKLPSNLLLDLGSIDCKVMGLKKIVCDTIIESNNLPFLAFRSEDGKMSAFPTSLVGEELQTVIG